MKDELKKIIQDLKNSLRNCNSATTGFLASVPSNMLSSRPFEPRFTSFAWEFACLIRTRYCYLDSLKTDQLKFNDREGIPLKNELLNQSKTDLLDKLSQTSNALLTEIAKIDSAKKVATVNWLLQHERTHHGKLTLYHSKAEYKLPDSFVQTWGESNFTKPK